MNALASSKKPFVIASVSLLILLVSAIVGIAINSPKGIDPVGKTAEHPNRPTDSSYALHAMQYAPDDSLVTEGEVRQLVPGVNAGAVTVHRKHWGKEIPFQGRPEVLITPMEKIPAGTVIKVIMAYQRKADGLSYPVYVRLP